MEFKARGYDKDTKQWFYGAYFKHRKYEVCPVQFSDEEDADKEPEYEHYIVFDGFADWNMAKPIKAATVDPKSVGVYIGREDKAGKEIYCGDILKSANGKLIGVVVYVTRTAGFAVALSNAVQLVWIEDFAGWEIIGNAYENFDLIKGARG